MRARRALMGLSLKLCLCVCSVRTGYHPVRAPLGALDDGTLRDDDARPENASRGTCRRRLNDERRQYDSERKRLARQQQSDSLRSLTAHERERTAQHCSRETTRQFPMRSA